LHALCDDDVIIMMAAATRHYDAIAHFIAATILMPLFSPFRHADITLMPFSFFIIDYFLLHFIFISPFHYYFADIFDIISFIDLPYYFHDDIIRRHYYHYFIFITLIFIFHYAVIFAYYFAIIFFFLFSPFSLFSLFRRHFHAIYFHYFIIAIISHFRRY
jgi:hypothetical protein